MMAACLIPGHISRLPWGLRPSRNLRWRLVNLTRDADCPQASPLTLPLCRTALALADSAGMELEAAVASDCPRLARAYRRYGFADVSASGTQLILRRTSRNTEKEIPRSRRWESVIRTGRVSATSLRARFGEVTGPVLDAGSGDSTLTSDLLSKGVDAVALDPQFAIRAPKPTHQHAVAGVMEQLPFATGVFATVHASYSLQHSSNPDRALRELLRVAGRDGVVLIHPVWGPARLRRAVQALPGVTVFPGRMIPPGRQRPSVRIACARFDREADRTMLIRALRPSGFVVAMGTLAMRLTIRLRKTTSVGPGAAR
ncbi:class I SAM-dependent methyltransferase [Streptomyces sp. NPDC002926]